MHFASLAFFAAPAGGCCHFGSSARCGRRGFFVHDNRGASSTGPRLRESTAKLRASVAELLALVSWWDHFGRVRILGCCISVRGHAGAGVVEGLNCRRALLGGTACGMVDAGMKNHASGAGDLKGGERRTRLRNRRVGNGAGRRPSPRGSTYRRRVDKILRCLLFN